MSDNNYPQIAFSNRETTNYKHFITTRHRDGPNVNPSNA